MPCSPIDRLLVLDECSRMIYSISPFREIILFTRLFEINIKTLTSSKSHIPCSQKIQTPYLCLSRLCTWATRDHRGEDETASASQRSRRRPEIGRMWNGESPAGGAIKCSRYPWVNSLPWNRWLGTRPTSWLASLGCSLLFLYYFILTPIRIILEKMKTVQA